MVAQKCDLRDKVPYYEASTGTCRCPQGTPPERSQNQAARNKSRRHSVKDGWHKAPHSHGAVHTCPDRRVCERARARWCSSSARCRSCRLTLRCRRLPVSHTATVLTCDRHPRPHCQRQRRCDRSHRTLRCADMRSLRRWRHAVPSSWPRPATTDRASAEIGAGMQLPGGAIGRAYRWPASRAPGVAVLIAEGSYSQRGATFVAARHRPTGDRSVPRSRSGTLDCALTSWRTQQWGVPKTRAGAPLRHYTTSQDPCAGR